MTITWTDRIRQRIQNTEHNIPWWVNDKVRLYKFSQQHNIPMPQMGSIWKHPDSIDLSQAPDHFVLKPSVMHSAWGVMVLSRNEDGKTFHESLTNRNLTEEKVKAEQVTVYDKCKYKGAYRIFYEERIFDAKPDVKIPFDYKVFCFDNEVELVQQMDRNTDKKLITWFDGNFNPLDLDASIETDWSVIERGVPVRPDSADEMLEIARQTSVALNTPFIRVDMFNSSRGPVMGELTPTPGGPYYGDWYTFTDSLNRHLGEAWSRAEQRVQARIS